jgi:endonuclease YncB( thermonuclease family)
MRVNAATTVVVLCHRATAFFLLFLASLVSAQSGGGYVVRGVPRVINGNTIVVGGTEVTLSGVKLADGYQTQATSALKKRVGSRSVGCMVDGNWSGKNWGYCGDPRKKSSRDIRKTLNAWMVKTGNALSDGDWNLFGSEEAMAKKKGKGLWGQ